MLFPKCVYVFADTDQSQDWTLRHGRVVALYVALKEACDKLVSCELSDKIAKTIHTYTTADRVGHSITIVFTIC